MHLTIHCHYPSLTRKNNFFTELGTKSLFNFLLLWVAGCGTPALLVTVKEVAELEVQPCSLKLQFVVSRILPSRMKQPNYEIWGLL